MLGRIPSAQSVTYAEIAESLNFKSLQRSLQAAARLTIVGTGLSAGIILGFLSIALLLDLHGLSFVLACMAAVGIPFAFAVLVTRRLSEYRPAWAALGAVIHEEWRSGRQVLPQSFEIPRMYRRLRVIPTLDERALRSLRGARRVLSTRFQLASFATVFVGTMLSIVLALAGVAGVILAIPALLPFGTVVGWIAHEIRHVRLLHELRQYEQITGKSVLPPDLAAPESPATN